MESQPQNPEFRINPENFHPCMLPLQVHVLMFLAISHATTNDASAKNSCASTAIHVKIFLTVSQKKTSHYHGNT